MSHRNIAKGIRETGDPTDLEFAAVADGQVPKRTGSNFVGATVVTLTSGEVTDLMMHHLIPAGTSGTNTFLAVEESSTSFVIKARVEVNFARFNRSGTTLKGTLYARLRVDNAASVGTIRLFNETDGVELGNITTSSTTNVELSIALSSLPSTGVKCITCEMKNDIGAKITVETADFDLFQEAT